MKLRHDIYYILYYNITTTVFLFFYFHNKNEKSISNQKFVRQFIDNLLIIKITYKIIEAF